MADSYDCGVNQFETWQRGEPYTVRWLGPFNPDMELSEVHERLEHWKLTAQFREAFERGWNAAKARAKEEAA